MMPDMSVVTFSALNKTGQRRKHVLFSMLSVLRLPVFSWAAQGNYRERATMKRFLLRMWHEQDGVLSFEWTLLTSLLTVGAVAGITSVRDAVQDEMGDLSEAMVSLDQSYRVIPPLAITVHTGNSRSSGGQLRVYEFDKKSRTTRTWSTGAMNGGVGSAFYDKPGVVTRAEPEAPAPAPEAQAAVSVDDAAQ